MAKAPRLRRVLLSAHIIGSVGWIGAATAYFALGVAASVAGMLRRFGRPGSEWG